jgi:uncharacterized protein (TIGR03546 family)
MFLLVWLRRLYKVLSADASPGAIAFAVAFGLTLGFVPWSSGMAWLLVAAVLIVRVQVSAALAAMAVAKLVAAVGAQALFYSVGAALLDNEGLRDFWTWFLNLPIVAWLELQQYVVLGGAVCGAVLGAVLFWPVRQLIVGYREFVHDRVSDNKFFRWLTGFWLTKVLRFIFIGARVGT